MLSWLSKKTDTPDNAPPPPELAEMLERDVAVIFKHSPSCAISWAAEKQVKAFIASSPIVPVYTVLVRQDRELSRRIAEVTKVRHESPQVIVLRRGVAVANASHQDVTTGFLTRAIAGIGGS